MRAPGALPPPPRCAAAAPRGKFARAEGGGQRRRGAAGAARCSRLETGRRYRIAAALPALGAAALVVPADVALSAAAPRLRDAPRGGAPPLPSPPGPSVEKERFPTSPRLQGRLPPASVWAHCGLRSGVMRRFRGPCLCGVVWSAEVKR